METIKDFGSYTFIDLVNNSLKKFSSRPAFAFASGTPITYGQVGKEIESFRTTLYQLGVDQYDAVALFSHNSPSWPIAYLSIATSGAIAVPLLPDFSASEVISCIEHSSAKTIIISSKLLQLHPQIASKVTNVICLDDFSILKGERLRLDSMPSRTVKEEDTASIIYTSGTTGRSKGVELTHKNLVFSAEHSQFFQRLNKYDVGLSILPLSHVYEFTIGFVLFFLNGACVYYLEKPPTVTTLMPALKTVRPTIMLSVPLIMEKIYKNKIVPTFTSKPRIAALYKKPSMRKVLHRISGISLKKTFGGRLKFFGIGGAKVDPVVEQFMKEAKFPYAIGYGLTETSPLLAGSGPKYTIPGTIGGIMPGVELTILEKDAVTGIGEVAARGSVVMKGYYKDPQQTAAVFTSDGWFKTGDLGSFDKNNRLSLKGRSKNMILNSAGENIYPEDIEFVLNQHPFVSESIVVERENSSLVALVQIDEEKISAEVKRRAEADRSLSLYEKAGKQIQAAAESMGGAVTEAVSEMTYIFQYKKEEILTEIKFFVNENVNRMSRIDKIEVIEKFEKTASQKIKRYIYNVTHAAHSPK